MTDEELIAELRKPWFTNGCERYQLDAANRIEALVEALKWIEALDDHAECCGKEYTECCGQPEYGLDRAKRVARNALAALKGADHV